MKKFRFKATPKMKKRMQPMQIPAKFFLNAFASTISTDASIKFFLNANSR